MTQKAPERIWTASTEGKCHVGFDTPSMNYTNEYVRADLAQAPAPVRVKAEVLQFPEDWRDRAHGFRGTFKMQAAWSDGFNAARDAIAALEPEAGVVAELVEAHRENARVLSHLHNDLQGRVDAAKLAALFECLARSTAALALAHNTTEG